MAAQRPGPAVWRFADAEFNEVTLELKVAGRSTRLERKPLEVLMFFLRNPGRLVKKEELMTAVWPGRVLSDSAFTSCIAKLREALGTDAQAILKTVHGYGYRLDVAVTSEAIDTAGQAPGLRPVMPVPSAEPRHRRPRRLAAIMFTDMVGYTALVQRDESMALKLLQRQRRIVRACLARHGGREVEVIGDAFLVEFASALQAVECAVTLQQQLAQESSGGDGQGIALRIGLHVGDIVRPGRGVFGDSVNVAARLQALAPEGGIALSALVYEQVYNKVDLSFEDRGLLALKGIERPVHVFAAAAAAVQACATPAPSRGDAISRWKVPALAVALTLAVLALALVWWREQPATDVSAASPPERYSIAVLPFANLSPQADDRYFVEGFHDSVLAKLSAVRELKVISRNSVLPYRDAKVPLNEIGSTLKVSHALEGSVQRYGSRVRITAQLIQIADDRQLWGEVYERDNADLFAIQAEITRKVVAAISVALSPDVAARIDAAYSKNPEAYDLYAQAAALQKMHYNTPEVLTRVESLLGEALRLDPQFALAQAELANAHMSWYRDGADPSPQRLQLVRDAVDAALAADPQLAEAHIQKGQYFYEGLRDYAAAEQAFARALELNPSSATTYEQLAFIRMDQARWTEAVDLMEKAVELDPQHRWLRGTLSNAYMFVRRFADALTQAEIMERLAADDPTVKLLRPFVLQNWKGDLQPLRDTLAEMASVSDSHPVVVDARLRAIYAEQRWADAVTLWQRCDCPWISVYRASRYPKALKLGEALQLDGRHDEARAQFERALDLIDAEIAANPKHGRNHAFRALALAGLSRMDEAVAAVDQALEMVPREDGWERLLVLGSRARILAERGDQQAALEIMARITKAPGPPFLYLWYYEPWAIPLREHPLFEAMLVAHKDAVR